MKYDTDISSIKKKQISVVFAIVLKLAFVNFQIALQHNDLCSVQPTYCV